MVFDHQVRMVNLLTPVAWEARFAAYEKRPADFRELAREVVDYLLYMGEAALTRRVEGSSGFAESFARKGRGTNRRGRCGSSTCSAA